MMDNRSPHLYPESFSRRYIENMMRFTYKHPVFMKDLFYIAGISSFMLMTSPWTLPALGMAAPLSTAAATGLGTLGMMTAFAHGYVQQKVFGLPVSNNKNHYVESDYEYNSAKARLEVSNDEFPILHIEAENPYDAGYAEGYILGNAIKNNLEKTNFLYLAMRVKLGAPNNNDDLKKDLDKVLQTIPQRYQQEMRGKVQGYNNWLAEHYPRAEKLSFEYYLLLQLLPDLHHNYNPFNQKGMFSHLISLLKPFSYQPKMGCTTMALHLGDYTFFTRVLDWPAYGTAGESFIQIDRKIGNIQRTIDIGLPLLSGAATVLNEHGLLIEINISPGDKVLEPAGMPAFFFNRYCAEKAASVEEIDLLIKNKKPLSAYHLTATEGKYTKSFHFYQAEYSPQQNAIEFIRIEKENLITYFPRIGECRPKNNSPSLLAVANHGLAHEKNNSYRRINHDDSNQRITNIEHFFKRMFVVFSPYLNKQKKGERLEKQDVKALKELMLQMARLPLVNNCESVLCAMYVYHNRELIDASAAVDNLYAQNKELSEFRRLKF